MPREEVSALEAPAAIGPYSHAIAIDGFLFCSGQLGLDAKTGQLVDGVQNQAERALMNLVAVLKAAGMSMADVVKTTIFLADLTHFSTVNEVYSRFVVEPAPARSTVQVAALPRGALVEIEAIARRSS
jgi:2-iminobutanoate/2-iminopropanoate deaminase